MQATPDLASSPLRQALAYTTDGRDAAQMVESSSNRILNRSASQDELSLLINLLLIDIHAESEVSENALSQPLKADHATSLYRQMLG